MTRLRWTEQAVGDLQAIREFIERDSPQYGRIVAERLFDATLRLDTFPLSGRIVPELGRRPTRKPIVTFEAYDVVVVPFPFTDRDTTRRRPGSGWWSPVPLRSTSTTSSCWSPTGSSFGRIVSEHRFEISLAEVFRG